MNHRADIANCHGQTPLAADVGTQWYHLKNPHDQEIMALTKVRLQQQQMLIMSCLTLQGGDYAVAAVQGPGHDRYGNASIGYKYATMSGAQGAQQFHQGMNMNVVSGVDMALVAQLEQMWKEVE